MTNPKTARYLQHIVVLILLMVTSVSGSEFTWKRVATSGGGMNIGLIVHPSVPDLVYGRHDVSGLYRWDPAQEEWIQLMDHMDMDWNKVRGCDGFAVDTTAGDNQKRRNIIYAAFGEISQEKSAWLQTAEGVGIWRSRDRGDTWTKIWDSIITTVDGKRIFSYASNSKLRMTGEPLAVDPFNPDILYAATRNAGLFRCMNALSANPTFEPIEKAPRGLFDHKANSTGIRVVRIDPRHGSIGTGDDLRARVIYLGVPQGEDWGVYRSQDGGESFDLVSSDESNRHVWEIALGPEKSILVSGGKGAGIRKFDGQHWSVLSQTDQEPKDFLGISTDPNNRNRIVTTAARKIWYSDDGGTTWDTEINSDHDTDTHREDWNTSVPTSKTIAMDPHFPNRVWLGNGWGVDQVVDITVIKTEAPLVIKPRHRGLATTVSMDICAPAEGAVLYNPAADMGGFIHENDLSKPPMKTLTEVLFDHEDGHPRSSIVSDIEVAPSDPKYVAAARSTNIGFGSAKPNIYLSKDYGKTWKEWDLPKVHSMPSHKSTATGNGKICFSSKDPNRLVFMGSNRFPHYCTNAFSGEPLDWKVSEGTDWSPKSILPWFPDSFHFAADPNDGMKFYYAYKNPGGNKMKVYVSEDGGATWKVPEGQKGLGQRLKTFSMDVCLNASGETELWVAGMRMGAKGKADLGLKRSTDGGLTFSEVNSDIVHAYNFAFGKAAKGSSNPSVFVAGHVTIGGKVKQGVFISDDFGKTFRQMTEDGKPIVDGYDLEMMEGDPNVYGRVFFSCHGKSVVYSEYQNQ